ncbi:MAG: (d)CMP kinase [Hyphomicrobiales bacterium]|nr:(d)CMP kinase [Hyphomicrobiales bacterium]
MIIAVDGPAASGKGTLARKLAAHYGLRYLDTGRLYRAVARAIIDSGNDTGDLDAAVLAARSIDLSTLDDDPRLRAEEVGEAASRIAAMADVRAALLQLQRQFAQTPPGAVLDGRDIGTVICPDADVKLFVTASAEERARRRTAELSGRGEPADYEAILADIRRRDARDAERTAAPLKPAENAHLLDTTKLSIEAAFRAAVDIVDSVRGA